MPPSRDGLLPPLRPLPLRTASPVATDQVWYLSYGSNMHAARLRCYLAGGRPQGGSRTYPGCRDPREPRRSLPVELPGRVYFALRSPVWTGGIAFLDPDGPGTVWARAHLVTMGQFCDIATQEMHREPGVDLDLTEVLASGRARLGPGLYETLVCPGTLDGHPVLTFTAPWGMSEIAWNAPSPGYLAHLTSGLLEAGAWDARDVAAYLAYCQGPPPATDGRARGPMRC